MQRRPSAALRRQGTPVEALAAVEHALRLRPDWAEAHLQRGVLLQQLARHQEAIEAFDSALRLKPGYSRAHFNRGVTLQAAGQLEKAVAAYEEALRLQPDLCEAHLNRALALGRLGRFPGALAALDQALRLRPGSGEAHFNRGNALRALGRSDEALSAYERALEIREDLGLAHFCRGLILSQRGRADEALASFEHALRLQPEFAEAHFNRGNTLVALGRFEDAVRAYDRSLGICPDSAQAYLNRGVLLNQQGRLAEALADYDQACRLAPESAQAQSACLYGLNYDPAQDEQALLDAHRAWGERQASPAIRPPVAVERCDPHKILRVGLVSADFDRHPVGYLIEPLLAAADPRQLHFFCYSGLSEEDDLTARLKRRSSAWRSTLGMSDAAMANLVRADAIDILIDLAGHTAANRLPVFALEPAPVQVSWIGYPCTTGLRAIGYALMDEATVPAGAERWFIERVVRLPETRFCYAPPEYAPLAAPPPMVERRRVTFGSFNNLAKVTPQVVRLWARVLASVPGARLVLKWKTLADPETRARYHRCFAAEGTDPARVELRPASPHPQLLAEYGDIDIALDPFPYSGGITSLEALWQGVPIVTLPGSRPVSRQTLGFLRNVGRAEWVALDPDDYVRISVGLASDPRALAAMRGAQRARMAASPLCDAPRFARHFEAALRALWHDWCAARPAFTRQRERQDVQGAG
jgi:predicted O-linked N-acetylglucosamine transferase (SPINDLY family)